MKSTAPQISLLAPLLNKKKLSPVTDSWIKTPKGVMCEHILINFVCFTTGASIWRAGSVKLQPTPIHHTALHKMARCIYLYIACRDENVLFFSPMYRPTLAMKNGPLSDKCEGCQRLSEIKMSASSRSNWIFDCLKMVHLSPGVSRASQKEARQSEERLLTHFE